MRTRAFLSILHNFWRWMVTYNSRETLSISVDQIIKEHSIDAEAFSAAFSDHIKYIQLSYTDPNGEAARFYSNILDTYRDDVIRLARGASLLRHGLFTGRLSAGDYDAVSALCAVIPGGTALRPLLRKIERVNKWRS